MMIGPTGVGKTEIARRWPNSPARSSRSRPAATRKSATTAATWRAWSANWSRMPSALSGRRKRRMSARRPSGGRKSGCWISWPPAPPAFDTTADRPELAGTLSADPRKDVGDAGRGRDGRAPRGVDHRAEGSADDVHRHGHGADGRRSARDAGEDRAAEHGAAGDVGPRGPASDLRAGVRRPDQRREGQRHGDRPGREPGHHLPRRDRQDRGQPSRRTGRMFRGKACSATSCRSSRAQRCRPATATSRAITSSSSPPGPFIAQAQRPDARVAGAVSYSRRARRFDAGRFHPYLDRAAGGT